MLREWDMPDYDREALCLAIWARKTFSDFSLLNSVHYGAVRAPVAKS